MLQVKELLSLLLIDVKLKEVMRQFPVMDRVPRIEPLTEQDEAIFQSPFQLVPLDRHPLLEQIVLRVHSFGDQMSPALQNHLAIVLEMNSDVRPIDLFLND